MTLLSEIQIAVVVSRFNTEVTERLREGTLHRLKTRGVLEDNIRVLSVPGAVEIPLTAQLLAKSQRYDAVIVLGAVIRGETSHYDYVCEQVSQGCQRVSLKHDLPVIFGVLTTENKGQAMERLGGQHGHKGYDAADAAIEMIQLVNDLEM